MAYTKPQVIAQNASSGSYAAGCPADKASSGSAPTGTMTWCKYCDRAQ
ncbi:hypothetical protein [Treponema sp.]|nr:hypothetical protein [Treponema sp.]MCQ2241030.1 hypothetical protein [Treponema sp.]